MRLDTTQVSRDQGPSARTVTADELADYLREKAASWQARHLARKHRVPLGAALILAEAAGFGVEGR